MDFEEFRIEFLKQLNENKMSVDQKKINYFYQYMKEIISWNEKINVTAITDEKEFIIKHFIDSLTVLNYIDDGEFVIDIGTGAGFPGIPIKIINDKSKVTLIDAVNKKLNVIRDISEKLHLNNLQILHSRAEDLAIDEKAFEDINEWGLDPQYVTELFAKFKKRARSSVDSQIMKRAIIVAISEKVNKESSIINTDTKSAGNGTLFCQFPQYTSDGKENGYSVQIDINVGNVDWLRFASHSDSYKSTISPFISCDRPSFSTYSSITSPANLYRPAFIAKDIL